MGRDRVKLSEEALVRIQRNLAMMLGLVGLSFALIGQVGSAANQELAATIPTIVGGPYTLVLAILVLMALKGIFGASELAVALLRPVHIRQLKEKGEKQGRQLEMLLDDQANVGAACKLGKELSMLCIHFVVIMLAPNVAVIAERLFSWPHDNLGNIVLCAALLWVFPVGPLTEIFEQAFRGYALAHPHGAAIKLNRFMMFSSVVLGIPARAATSFSRFLSARFRPKGTAPLNQAEEEIKVLVESAQESGEIEQDERELLHSVFEFTDTMAREVMTPRVDLDAVPTNSDPEEVMKVIKETGHSRIPVYEGTDDQIVGIIHAKDLLMALISNEKPNFRDLIRPTIFVPENKPLNELLAEMRANRTQMAIVNDEYGGTAGVVTIEDIVEELVGDIMDEYDIEEPELEASGKGWSVDGKMHIDDLNHVIGTDFESEEFDTVGGFVFGHFGRQPREAESIVIDDHKFTVIGTDGRRIERLLIEPLESAVVD